VVVDVDEGSSNQYKCSGGDNDLHCVNRVLSQSKVSPPWRRYFVPGEWACGRARSRVLWTG